MALIHCDFFSEVLGQSVSMDVILPQPAAGQIGMAGGGSERTEHPCLYLLHGLSDDHTIWQRRTSIERYVAPLGLAVVMPNAGRSFYTDMKQGQRYGTFISEEVPALARSFFKLSDKREDNFIAGLSMGGYGAFKIALSHPDKFSAAASLSGALDLASRVAQQTDFKEDFNLIFGQDADISGTEHDLLYLAEQNARSKVKPRLFQCCGTEDFLYQDNLRFRDHAMSLGLDLTYEEGPGIHEWGYWDTQIQQALEWLGTMGD